MDKWVVQSASEMDDESGLPLYWSNEFGWGDLSEATFFTNTEKENTDNLPADSQWVQLDSVPVFWQ